MTVIITAAQRATEPHGARIVIVGPNGVGKTSLARGLDPDSVLFLDVENGGLAVADHPMAHIRVQSWLEIKDVIVRVVGPNRSFAPQESFSREHFEKAGGWLPGIENYQTIFLDTITAASRICLHWAAQQPESFSDRSGRLDQRSAYGLLAREFLLSLRHLQSARSKNVVLTGALETVTDDYGRTEHKLQAEGRRVPAEIGGIVDEVITMNFVDFGDGKPVRAFVCTSPNPWNFPAKDRSGKLDQLEAPNLDAVIRKILSRSPHPLANHGASAGAAESLSPSPPATKAPSEKETAK